MTQKVQVWLFRRGDSGRPEVLLLRTTPERGGFWQPVTGSAEAGEGHPAAAAREAEEETGLALAPESFRAIGHAFEFESRWGGRAREEVFVAKVRGDDPVKTDSREHVDFRWVESSQADSFLAHEETKNSFALALKFFSENFSSGQN